MTKIGHFLGVPYDFRFPTFNIIKNRLWNPSDKRILTPHIFGWGWSINFYQFLKLLKIIK